MTHARDRGILKFMIYAIPFLSIFIVTRFCHAETIIEVRSPLDQIYMTNVNSQGFCSVNSNLPSPNNIHTGNDIPVPAGKFVYALCDGKVAYDNTAKGYWDSFLIVQHDCGERRLYAYYGHVTSAVNNPNHIVAGEVIAKIRGDSGQYGEHLHLSISTGSDWDRRGWGYDSSCENIKAENYQNPSSFLRFSAASTISGPNQQKLGDSYDNAVTIKAVGVFNGSLNKDKKRYFIFSAKHTANYVLFSRSYSHKYGELYDNQFNRIAGDGNDGEGGNNFRITKRLIAGQTYYLMVRGDPGNYAVHLEGPEGATTSDDHGFSSWSATAVKVGATTHGTIDVPNDQDYFKFTPTQTATYVVFSRSHSHKHGELYDNQFNRIAGDGNDGEGGNNFRITKRLIAGQTYYLMVRGDPGNYAVHLEGPEGATTSDDHGFSSWSATAVKVGSTTPGTIDVPNDQDYFKFTPTQTANYVAFSRSHSHKHGELYDNQFNRIAGDGNDGEGGNNFRVAKRLIAGQTYYLMVRGDPGNYAVHLEGPEGATTSDDHGFSSWSATAVKVGSTTPGTIDVPNDQDYFKFTPKQDATYVISTRANRGLSGALHDQDFNMLRSDHGSGVDRNIRIEQKLAGGQTYFMVIRGEPGPYELHVGMP